MTAFDIGNESNDHKYFTVTPRLVWALSRNVYDYAFWSIIRDLAGESGHCKIGAHKLGQYTMMSASKAHACRQYWMDAGLLVGIKEKTPGGMEIWRLSIPDRWLENVMWSQKYKSIADRLQYKRSFLNDIAKGIIRTADAAARAGLDGQIPLFDHAPQERLDGEVIGEQKRSLQERSRSLQEHPDEKRSLQERDRSCGTLKEEQRITDEKRIEEFAVASAPAPSENGAKTDDITQPVDVSLAGASNGHGESAEIAPDHKSIGDIPIQTSTTRKIQDRYCELLGYKPDNWAEGESVAAKAIASLCTADEFEACYESYKSQKFWRDKRLTLRYLRNQVQGYLIHTGKRSEVKNGRKQNGQTTPVRSTQTIGGDSSYAASVAKAVTAIHQRSHAGVGEQSPLPVLRADQGTVQGAGSGR